MAKKNVGRNFDLYPMPVVIVGAITDGQPNFMTAAWLTKIHSDPPMLAIALGERQHTAKGIKQTGEFSVNYPSVDQAALADYLGLVHGDKVDKAKLVEVWNGALQSAPMVFECPVSLECRVTQTIDLPHDYLFLAEVVNVYATESVLTDGKVDPAKLRPFMLTMPDNSYWTLGERVGSAWDIGKAYVKPS
jgi:flavin reductase (DIM6/NTAB) family NADH-FMN oxidoreductase RutF